MRFFGFLALSFLVTSSAFAQRQIIKVDGSSTVYPITEAVAEEFRKVQPKINVTVGISGTGGGFKKFCRGEIDVLDASRPITKNEMADCKKAGVQYVELPVAFDAITIVVSPKNDWVSSITVEELKKIWAPESQGKITKWNQIRPEWPDAPLKLFGAGADSGTFDYFTEAIMGRARASRPDYTPSEDDNTLVIGISSDKYALGFLPYAYYEPNKKRLKALAIGAGAKAVAPSAETVEKGSYSPLSRPLFIYVSEASLKKPEVKEFAQFYMEQVGTLALQVKNVPLPKKAYELATEYLKKGRVGTVFGGGMHMGLAIDQMLKKKASL